MEHPAEIAPGDDGELAVVVAGEDARGDVEVGNYRTVSTLDSDLLVLVVEGSVATTERTRFVERDRVDGVGAGVGPFEEAADDVSAREREFVSVVSLADEAVGEFVEVVVELSGVAQSDGFAKFRERRCLVVCLPERLQYLDARGIGEGREGVSGVGLFDAILVHSGR